MKTKVLILLILGLVSVIASPVSEQTTSTDNIESPLSESSDSETKQEATLDNVVSERENTVTNENRETVADIYDDITKNSDANVDILIEDNIRNPVVAFPEAQFDFAGDDMIVNDDVFRNLPVVQLKDEIMETAAGFAPLPFLKTRRQKPQRRFATRRYYKNKPRRNYHFFYPYYSYYRPSSLRYYY